MSLPTSAVRARVSRLRPDSRARSRLSVVPPRVTTARSGPFVLLVAVILVVGLVGLLMLNLSMQKASFRLASLQDHADALQTREQSLDVKVDRLSSSDRLADEAARMGMVPNPNPVFLDLSNGKVIGDPAVAQPRALPAPSEDDSTGATDEDTTPNDDNASGGDAATETSANGDSSIGHDGAATHEGGAATDGGDSATGHGNATDHTGANDSTDSTDSTAQGSDRGPDATGRGR